MEHNIVFLEDSNVPPLDLDFPYTCQRYPHTSPHEVIERIREATIVVTGVTAITVEHLSQAKYLQCIAITATGFEWLDRQAFAERGITVVNCPQSNVDAVGEHFLALYFAARRKIVEVHNAVTGPGRLWIQEGSLAPRWRQGPPLSCQQEILGIIGYGAVGRKIEDLARGVGMSKILISERKGETQIREGRLAYEEVIKTATTIVLCCAKEPGTINMVAEPDFRSMKPTAVLINLSRGGIVCEQALLAALKEGTISGAAMDVLETEPGGIGTTPLIPDTERGEECVPNLTLSSHIAWFSEKTVENLARLLKLGIEGHVLGTLMNEHSKATAIVYKGKSWR